MTVFPSFLLLSLSLFGAAFGAPRCNLTPRQEYGGSYGGSYGSPSGSGSTGSSSSGSSGSSGAGSNVTTSTGGAATTGSTQCTPFMCITAAVSGSTTTWSLQSKGSQAGWMAMGFGKFMSNSPMVIMWANPDGSVTLSQRTAPTEELPTVDPNPPSVATASTDLSVTTGSQQTLAFTMPSTSGSSVDIIWAFGTDTPSSSAVDATFNQHTGYGTLSMDITTPLSSSSGSSGSSSSNPSTSSSSIIPLTYYQKLIIAHAVFCTLGFLLLLPSGVLLARFFRTVYPGWFTGHWIAQAGLAGPAIIIGISLGVASVSSGGGLHLNDDHKRWGIILLVLYLLQCTLGGVIHWIKPKNAKGRPAQNYLHAVLGLLIIGLAFYQVRTGYRTEWMLATGILVNFSGADIVWYVWVFLLPILYAGGLSLLPRQFRQESAKKMPDDFKMGASSYKPRF